MWLSVGGRGATDAWWQSSAAHSMSSTELHASLVCIRARVHVTINTCSSWNAFLPGRYIDQGCDNLAGAPSMRMTGGRCSTPLLRCTSSAVNRDSRMRARVSAERVPSDAAPSRL